MGMRFWVALVALVLSLAGSITTHASAQSAAIDDATAATRWVRARVRAARAGHADLVSVPVAFASAGWGCTCPPNYIGWSADVGDGPAWLSLEVAQGVELPVLGPRGGVLMLEGFLTGNVSRFQGDADQRYTVYELVVTRVVARHVSDTPRMRVVTAGARACTSTVTDTTPLHVHQRSGVRTPVVGDVPVGATVTVRDVRDEWLALSAPLAGWVSAFEVTTTCAAGP